MKWDRSFPKLNLELQLVGETLKHKPIGIISSAGNMGTIGVVVFKEVKSTLDPTPLSRFPLSRTPGIHVP